MYEDVVLPRWDLEPHHFASTLYGYVMACFAFVDLLSKPWQPSTRDQTLRMTYFMDRHIGQRGLAHEIAIQMWRHALMHTGGPQRFVETNSQTTYLWLLHWGREHLPPDQHMTFSELGGGERILNMTLFYLLEDLIRGGESLFSEAEQDADLGRRIERTHASVREYRFGQKTGRS